MMSLRAYTAIAKHPVKEAISSPQEKSKRKFSISSQEIASQRLAMTDEYLEELCLVQSKKSSLQLLSSSPCTSPIAVLCALSVTSQADRANPIGALSGNGSAT